MSLTCNPHDLEKVVADVRDTGHKHAETPKVNL